MQTWRTAGAAVLMETDETVLIAQHDGKVRAVRVDDGRAIYALDGPCTTATVAKPGLATSSSAVCEEHHRGQGRGGLSLRVHEPATGAQRLALDVPLGSANLLTEDRAVFYGLDEDSRVTLEARFLTTGERIWSWTDDTVAGDGLAGVSVWQQGSEVLVAVGDGKVTVLESGSGRELSGAPSWSPYAAGAVDLLDGRQVRQGARRAYGPAVEVLDADGSLAWSAAGYLVAPDIDDGSRSDLVFVQSLNGLLHARDAQTGERRWLRWAAPQHVQVVAGVVLLEEDDVFRALVLKQGTRCGQLATSMVGMRQTAGRSWSRPLKAGSRPATCERDACCGRYRYRTVSERLSAPDVTVFC